jgi:hypothetical protein
MADEEILIQFMGICTHFSQANHPELPVSHRVVLVRADVIDLPPINGQLIPAHFAAMTVTTAQGMVSVPLTGCTLSFVNAIGAPDFDLTGVPNLTDLSDNTIGAASTPVLLGRNPNVTACWFDFDHGTNVVNTMDDGEISTTFTVTTDGPPLLLYRQFPNVIWPPPATMQFQPTPGSTVLVHNLAMPPNEDDPMFHFYLSYLTAFELPSVMGLPTTTTETGGPGCSNSNYP